MFSKEEAKSLRLEFWERFKNYSAIRRKQKGQPGRWMMEKTGIKALNLKFNIDREIAIVGIDIETLNLDKRLEMFDKLESLKALLEESIKTELTWEVDYTRENGKSISRIYTSMKDVDIYNKDCWPDVFKFFYTNMMKLEAFYNEYKDFLKYGPS